MREISPISKFNLDRTPPLSDRDMIYDELHWHQSGAAWEKKNRDDRVKIDQKVKERIEKDRILKGEPKISAKRKRFQALFVDQEVHIIE